MSGLLRDLNSAGRVIACDYRLRGESYGAPGEHLDEADRVYLNSVVERHGLSKMPETIESPLWRAVREGIAEYWQACKESGLLRG